MTMKNTTDSKPPPIPPFAALVGYVAGRDCPECGCQEHTHGDQLGKGYRVCANCWQEWWKDIDYSKS